MDRRRGFVCFRKGICDDLVCDCRKNEVQAINIMKLPVSRKWAFPPITPDPQHLNHNMTFRQLATALKYSNPDEHLNRAGPDLSLYALNFREDNSIVLG